MIKLKMFIDLFFHCRNAALLEDESQITEMIPFPIDIDKSKRSLTSELYSDG